MAYYITIKGDKIVSIGQCPCSNEDALNYEVSEEVYNSYAEDTDRYIWNGTEIVENPDYEELKRKEKQAEIDNLTMTALDFITFLKQSGITDAQIEAYLNANLSIKHQLQFCQNVYCGVAKALMPISVGDITITAEMVETAFKLKNGLKDDNTADNNQ